MREFYWTCLVFKREVYPLAYTPNKAKADAGAAAMEARVRELGGNVSYVVLSDEGNASRFLDRYSKP